MQVFKCCCVCGKVSKDENEISYELQGTDNLACCSKVCADNYRENEQSEKMHTVYGKLNDTVQSVLGLEESDISSFVASRLVEMLEETYC